MSLNPQIFFHQPIIIHLVFLSSLSSSKVSSNFLKAKLYFTLFFEINSPNLRILLMDSPIVSTVSSSSSNYASLFT